MAPKFSLNDVEIREIYNVARTSNNADVLRGMIYKLIKLRKEMAVSIHQLSTSRADLAAINESASAALAMDKKTGLLALLDRKGLINELQQQITKQLQALTRLANEKASLQQELQSVRNSNDGKAIIQALRQEIANAESSLSQLKQQNQLTSAKANQLESNNQLLTEKIRELETLIAESPQQHPADTSRETAEIGHAQLESSNQLLTEKVSHLEALIVDLRRQLETVETLEKTAQPQAAQLGTQPSQTDAQPSEVNSFVRELFNQQITALVDKNLQLEEAVALLNDQNQAISAQLQVAREQVQKLSDEMSAIKEAHQTEREGSAQELLTANNKLANLEQQLSQQISQIDRLTAENDRLQLELKNSNTTISALQQQIASKDGQISSLNLNLSSERDRIENLQSLLSRTEGDLSSAKQVITQRDAENQQISGELQQLSERLAEAVNLSTANELQLRAEIDSLNENLRASLGRVEYLESDKVNLEKNIRRLNDRSERLAELKRQLQESLRQISEDRLNLRQLASSISLENSTIRKENVELKDICQAQADELVRLGSQLTLASKVIHLRGPEARKDAQLNDESSTVEGNLPNESSGPSN